MPPIRCVYHTVNSSFTFHLGIEARKPVFSALRITKAQTKLRIFESIISRLATREISYILLVSVAEETGLRLALSENSKTGFVARKLICELTIISRNHNVII